MLFPLAKVYYKALIARKWPILSINGKLESSGFIKIYVLNGRLLSESL
jgi:hypothetical protein